MEWLHRTRRGGTESDGCKAMVQLLRNSAGTTIDYIRAARSGRDFRASIGPRVPDREMAVGRAQAAWLQMETIGLGKNGSRFYRHWGCCFLQVSLRVVEFVGETILATERNTIGIVWRGASCDEGPSEI